MRASRLILAASASVACMAAAGPAHADEQGEIDKVRAAYLAQRYDEALIRLREMLDPKHPTLRDPALVTEARMYLAAVLIAKKQPDAANPVFEKIILDDPNYEPDPFSFPTEVLDQFIDVRGKLREKLNEQAEERARREAERRIREEEEKKKAAERLAMLERLAGEEKVTTVSSRWLALVPFGVGQFQNGDKTLGWVFLVSEGACLAATAITVPIFLTDLQDRSNAYRSGDLVSTQEYINRANDVRDVNLALVGAFGVLALAGVIESQVNFVPESTTLRKRPLPAAWVVPTIAPSGVGSGGTVGIVGKF